MNAYIIILIITGGHTFALNEHNDHYLNVGSVLFTAADINMNTWTKNQIALLRARRYFQISIPPVEMLNSLNEDYVEKLISYFKNSYSLVKKEASDPVDETILTTALSDVIGGYLKVWALPITRYAFYGGTISPKQAVKLHRFYKEVKDSLGTDGVGWHKPDPNLLRFVEINIAPRRVTNTRETLYPCENLGLFEKSSTGLSVPIPYINWDDRSCTMFIPMKNESLIPLKSPSKSDALFRYYDTAKNCMQTTNAHDQVQFEDKFQSWLSKDVIPHLNDDDLYLAFGNILTLVNKTKSLCDTVIDLYSSDTDNSTSAREKFSIGSFHINFASKKVMIISIIIFLEIMWCIPAFIYLVCIKKKKVKENESNVYLYLDSKKRKRPKNIETSSRVEIDIGTDPDPTTTGGIKFSQKPRRKNECNSKHNTVATECSSSFIAKSYHLDPRLLNYESRSIQMRSSLKNILEKKNLISASSEEVLIYSPDKVILDASYSTVKNLDATKTVTVIKDNNKDKRRSILDMKAEHKNGHKDKKSSRQQVTADSKIIPSMTAFTFEEAKGCLCTCCHNDNDSVSIKNSKTTIQRSSTLIASCIKCASCTNKNSEIVSAISEIEIQNEKKPSKHKGVKANPNKKPYLEITIDRQQRDICLEISGGTTKKDKTKNVKDLKRSKIPMRTMYCPGHATLVTSKKTQSSFSSMKKNSLIPQLKKRPADDIDIKGKKPAGKNSKLNVTF